MHKGFLWAGILSVFTAAAAFAANPHLSEVEIEAAGKVERNAGVWLDDQYVGLVKDLKGKGKLVMLPGEHRLLFKLVGYEDVASTIVINPGEQKEYRVSMNEAAGTTYPDPEQTARVRISVEPDDAAVFVDGAFVGHVARFSGRRGMRLESGTHRITIALPGYQPFETQLTLRAGQDYEVKTTLPEGTLEDQADELTVSSGN